MPQIQITLPNDQKRPGTLRFMADDMSLRFKVPCLSEIPTGTYRVDGFKHIANSAENGMNDGLAMHPTGGNALRARVFGRDTFLIHGGPPDGESLRPAEGAVRISDLDMLGMIFEIQANGMPSLVIVSEGTNGG